MHQATITREESLESNQGRQSLSREDTMESLLSSPDLDSAIWSINLDLETWNLDLGAWTFDIGPWTLEDTVEPLLSLPNMDSTIWCIDPEVLSYTMQIFWRICEDPSEILERHRNQARWTRRFTLSTWHNKDDTIKSVLCTIPTQPQQWHWIQKREHQVDKKIPDAE